MHRDLYLVGRDGILKEVLHVADETGQPMAKKMIGRTVWEVCHRNGDAAALETLILEVIDTHRPAEIVVPITRQAIPYAARLVPYNSHEIFIFGEVLE